MNTDVDALGKLGESGSSWISKLFGYFSGGMGIIASGMANTTLYVLGASIP